MCIMSEWDNEFQTYRSNFHFILGLQNSVRLHILPRTEGNYSSIFKGHHGIVKFLISDCNCNPQCCTNRGFTPLHCACENGHLEVVRYLIKEHKCNPEHPNINGITPLHSAAINGHLAVVKYLITELGCDLQIGNNYGVTPLHYATFKGHHDIVKFDCNCNPECCTNDGTSPLHCACGNGHLEVAKYLVKEHKCNPELGDINGYTPLHSAARNGHLAVVKYLISELGCNPQIFDRNGCTPLHYAALNGHHDIVKFLISDCKCNPHCCTNGKFQIHGILQNGMTPLFNACLGGHLDIVKYLVAECKCNPGKRMEFKIPEQAIEEIISRSLNILIHPLSVKYLISTLSNTGMNLIGIFSNIGIRGFTPLHAACREGHLEIVKYLITGCECDSNSCDNLGMYMKVLLDTVLHSCGEWGLLGFYKEVCELTDLNFTPLQMAIILGDLETVKVIYNYCPHTGVTSPQDYMAFIGACIVGKVDIIKYILPQCSEILSVLLVTPCLYGRLDIVKFLIEECGCA